jgi:hypothetical protein
MMPRKTALRINKTNPIIPTVSKNSVLMLSPVCIYLTFRVNLTGQFTVT